VHLRAVDAARREMTCAQGIGSGLDLEAEVAISAVTVAGPALTAFAQVVADGAVHSAALAADVLG
jgi:hypothetical protein